MYEAIRLLSIVKEAEDTHKLRLMLLKKQSRFTKQHGRSEMAQIRNLHWWTVEYGLIGTVENPKIYGAGLLSSMAKVHCMTPEVTKILMIFRLLHKILILLNSNRSCMLRLHLRI
jgi:phenylalanine-4-hydroxylase